MAELSTVLGEAFDVAKEEGSPAFEPVAAGHYAAVITDAKVGPLKSGKGQAVQLTWELLAGYIGRLVFDRVIVSHESAEATKYGRRKFKDIADACGIKEAITDLSVLRNKPCLITVKIENDDNGEYAPKNVVTRVRAIKTTTNGNGPELNDAIPF